MHLAMALTLIAVTLNLTTAVAQFAISRAPGWRAARTFSVIALTATLYSLGNLVFSSGGWSDTIYIAASRWNYDQGEVQGASCRCSEWNAMCSPMNEAMKK